MRSTVKIPDFRAVALISALNGSCYLLKYFSINTMMV